MAPRAGRRDHHPVRHGGLRVPRPAQDGLPGPAQPHRPRRLPAPHRGQPRRDGRPRGARPSTTGATYELLARGDTLGRVPARRRPACARCCTRWRPTTSRTSPRSWRSTGPGPMGANAHNDYADRKNGRKPVTPIHPELAEPLAEILGDTYGLIVYQEQVMAIAQKLAGYSPGQRGPAAPRDGQEEEGDPRQGVRPLRRGDAGQRLLRGRDQDALGHPRPVLRLRLQQGAHRRVRPGLLLDRLPQGQLPGRVHGRRCSPSIAGRQGQVRDLPQRVPAHGHQGPAARRQRVASPTSPRVGTDIRFGLSAIRNVGANVVDSIIRTRTRQGPVRRLRRLHRQGRDRRLQQARRRVADQGRCLRQLRRHPQGAAGRSTSRPSTPPWTPSAPRRSGSSTCSAAWAARSPRPPRAPRLVPPPTEWDKKTLLAYEREMLGLYVSDHPLFGARARAELPGGHADLRARRRRARRRADGHGRRAGHQRPAQDHQGQGRAVGDRHPRGPRRVGGGDVLPAAVRDRGGRCWPRTS